MADMQSEYVPDAQAVRAPVDYQYNTGPNEDIVQPQTQSSSTEHFEEIGLVSQEKDYFNMTVPQHNHNELQALLSSWKLEFLLEHFKFELIDVDILKIIKFHHLERLMSKYPIGTQVYFEHQLSKWREDIGMAFPKKMQFQSNIPNHNGIGVSVDDAIDSTISGTEENSCQITLAEILKESGKGTFLIHYYEKVGKLQEEQRSILVNMICKHFCDRNANMSLATSYRLEAEICQRFPTEKPDFYRTGKRGKLYNRCCNLKSSFKPILLTSSSTEVESRNERTSELGAELCERSLKFDNLSVEEFDRTWLACSKHRLNDIKCMSNTEDILQKWPFYKRPSGYRLIDMDFKVLFPENTSLLDKWAEYSSLLTDFLYRDGSVKDKNVSAVLLQLKRDNEFTENSRNAIILWSLHAYLVPTQKTVTKNNAGQKSTIKYTIRDSQDSFLFVGKSIQELDAHILFLSSKVSHIQPFLLGVGSSISDLHEIYVYLDGVKFSFSNIIRAADICFKIFHVFHLEYPYAATNFYSFLQELFYGIKNGKPKNTKISVLLHEMNPNN